jgi:hypothetical protein
MKSLFLISLLIVSACNGWGVATNKDFIEANDLNGLNHFLR